MEDDQQQEPLNEVAKMLGKLDQEATMEASEQKVAEWRKVGRILVDDKLTATELSDKEKILVQGSKTICGLSAELQAEREKRVVADSIVTCLEKKLEDMESVVSTLLGTINNNQNDLQKVSRVLDTKNALLNVAGDVIRTQKRKRDINQNNTMAKKNHQDSRKSETNEKQGV